MTLHITVDDLTTPTIAALLQEHVDQMRAITPPESKHALDLDSLRAPDITLWSAHDDNGHLVGCAALKHLDPTSAEIKSMRTATTAQRRGVAAALLTHLITEARNRGYHHLYLETGAGDFFHPARTLYQRFGFQPCPPFADYQPDTNSVHLTRTLHPALDHLDAYTRLYVDVFNNPPWNETWQHTDATQRLHDILTTPRAHAVHTTDTTGAMTGFAIGHRERHGPTDHFLLQEMCVHPDHQRQGIGTRLLADLTRQLPDVTHWYLLTGRDTPAAAFYQANGFRPAGRNTVFARP